MYDIFLEILNFDFVKGVRIFKRLQKVFFQCQNFRGILKIAPFKIRHPSYGTFLTFFVLNFRQRKNYSDAICNFLICKILRSTISWTDI